MTLLIPCLTFGEGSIDSHDSEVNVASDFMALYTTRQKYRRPDISLLNSADGQVLGIGGRSLVSVRPLYQY
jgi:phosphatidylinositol 4-kinase